MGERDIHEHDAGTERLVDPQPWDDDARESDDTRPKYFSDMVGQTKLQEKLKIAIEAACKRGSAMDHALVYGPPGLGKTTLAYVIANELGVDVKVTSREPYDTGVAGGSAYERLDGSLTFAVDPHSPANAPLTDLGLAPTDEDGRVRFTSDFCLLHSTEPAETGRALVDIVNRGR